MEKITENSEKKEHELANAILQDLEKKSGRRLQENHLLPAGEDRRRQRGEFNGALFAIENKAGGGGNQEKLGLRSRLCLSIP